MKKTIKLTENELISVIKKIIVENIENEDLFKQVLKQVEDGETVTDALKNLGIERNSTFYRNLSPEQYRELKMAKTSHSYGGFPGVRGRRSISDKDLRSSSDLKDLEKSLKTKSPWDKYDWEEEDKRYDKYDDLNEACWKGYTQKGMKTMFGKRYPNCVKKNK